MCEIVADSQEQLKKSNSYETSSKTINSSTRSYNRLLVTANNVLKEPALYKCKKSSEQQQIRYACPIMVPFKYTDAPLTAKKYA